MTGRPAPACFTACALAALWVLAAGCTRKVDHGQTPCLPQTCAGCCNALGQCVAGDEWVACGTGGLACQGCAATDRCVEGACVANPPPVQPPTDGGQVLCGPASCAGCCQGNTCLATAAQTSNACGAAGAVCRMCSAASSCQEGSCELPASCDLRVQVVMAGNVGVVDFGRVPVGGTAQGQVGLLNVGQAPCAITAPAWQGAADRNAFGFAGQSAPLLLEPGAQAAIPLVFTPYAQRLWVEHANAFTFTANDSAASQCASNELGCRRVVVMGEGFDSPLLPSAPLAPDPLEFGEVKTGCESSVREVLLVNESAQALTVSSVVANGPTYELVSPATPLQLPGWGTARLRVRVLPVAAGKQEGMLEVDDGRGGQRQLELRATGVLGPRTERFVQPPHAYTDALFVVHNGSGSGTLQEKLASAAQLFVQEAQARGSAWRVGVVTSDATQAGAGRLQGPARWVSGTDQAAAAVFAESVRVGLAGALDQSTEAARLAVLPPLSNDPLQNGGFLRRGARLAIVVVTDAADQSPAPVADYADALAAAAGAPLGSDRVRTWALTAAGCSSGSRYLQLTARTGGGCRSLVGTTLETVLTEVAADLFAPQTELTLGEPLDLSQPISVRVGEYELPSSAFTVDPSRNALRLLPGYQPEPGQQVDVTYSPVCHP